jgi:hypothetical protein
VKIRRDFNDDKFTTIFPCACSEFCPSYDTKVDSLLYGLMAQANYSSPKTFSPKF